MRAVIAGVLVSLALSCAGSVQTPPDTLASWNDGPAKKAIVDFVARVTTAHGPDFVRPAERIATFDNDGTLWAEQPMYFQLLFAVDRLKATALQHPEWKHQEPFASLIRGDLKSAAASGEHALLEALAGTHAGMTTDEFNRIVTGWLTTARHPKTQQPFTRMVYAPMLELLDYLRANGFKTFIVSGGGVEFIRAFAEETYGIPPEQVVGSIGTQTLEMRDGAPVIVKGPGAEFVDDGPGKPLGIHQFIGRRPIAAFGNSDGDLPMLQWTCASGPRLCLYVHHTDAAREWAYDRASTIGKLDKGLDEARVKNWIVVDMKTDWRRIFVYENR
jgi:phosphoserine phosphatase